MGRPEGGCLGTRGKRTRARERKKETREVVNGEGGKNLKVNALGKKAQRGVITSSKLGGEGLGIHKREKKKKTDKPHHRLHQRDEGGERFKKGVQACRSY